MMRKTLTMALSITMLSCIQSAPEATQEREQPQRHSNNYAVFPVEPGQPHTVLLDPQPVVIEEKGQVSLLPPPAAREKMRLTVAQLRATLNRVTGDLVWADQNGNDRWEGHLSALSVPNFETTTREDLSYTLLYDKLLGDAARDLCPALLKKEVSAEAKDRVFLMEVDPNDTYKTAPNKVAKNLSRLLLKFHGRKLLPNDPKLEHWRFMVESTMHLSNDPVGTWTAVCVALITHPHFSGY